eukprot:TRINITY_DN35037_c0_g1_i1.p1 TRINITY_DN35037_c0_g1~~TRINITY_DN35037_c0_g1_i1.p1  ORF type:complete len:274 (+),score=90.87 TRINITY_DN35037_c0_g1_i1:41-862(+)
MYMNNMSARDDPARSMEARVGKLMHDPQVETFKAKDINVVHEERTEDEAMGTTIMATVYKDGVVLASDTRTSAGPIVMDYAAPKIMKITDNIHCCRCGTAADSQFVVELVAKYVKNLELTMDGMVPVEVAARLFEQVAFHNRAYLGCAFIIAGVDDKNGGQVYAITSDGLKTNVTHSIMGSGSVFAYGFIDGTYNSSMTEAECLTWIKQVVAHSKARDASSGGSTRTRVVTLDGYKSDFVTWGETPYRLETDPTFAKMNPEKIPHAATTKTLY